MPNEEINLDTQLELELRKMSAAATALRHLLKHILKDAPHIDLVIRESGIDSASMSDIYKIASTLRAIRAATSPGDRLKVEKDVKCEPLEGGE